MKLLLVVAAALVDADDRVLIARRPEGKTLAGLWEFPGGKVEAGERPEAALIRELTEELDLTVAEPCLAPLTFASHAYPDFHLLMPLYICRRWQGLARAREGQALRWVRPRQLRDYPDVFAQTPSVRCDNQNRPALGSSGEHAAHRAHELPFLVGHRLNR